VNDAIKPRGARKATLTKKAVEELGLKIDCALQAEGRRRLGRSAVDFLTSIRGMLTTSVVRLSKKQRVTAEEILTQAFSGEPLVFLQGQAMADLASLFRYATGDGRVSSFDENVMLGLKRRLDEHRRLGELAIAVSPKQWHIVEEIKQKTRFGLPGEPPPIDPGGLIENEDPDGLPPECDEKEADSGWDWAIAGVHEDEDR
jgi:hypothetical protein